MGCSKPKPDIGELTPREKTIRARAFGDGWRSAEANLKGKTIDQFTTDELLAEIKRRLK